MTGRSLVGAAGVYHSPTNNFTYVRTLSREGARAWALRVAAKAVVGANGETVEYLDQHQELQDVGLCGWRADAYVIVADDESGLTAIRVKDDEFWLMTKAKAAASA